MNFSLLRLGPVVRCRSGTNSNDIAVLSPEEITADAFGAYAQVITLYYAV